MLSYLLWDVPWNAESNPHNFTHTQNDSYTHLRHKLYSNHAPDTPELRMFLKHIIMDKLL